MENAVNDIQTAGYNSASTVHGLLKLVGQSRGSLKIVKKGFSFFVFREKGPGTCTRARELIPLVTALLAVLILLSVSCSAL